MKLFPVVSMVVVVFFLTSLSAQSTSYVYDGSNLINVWGQYTTAMKVQGYFTTASPLPPGTDDDIAALVTDFSFTDGLQMRNPEAIAALSPAMTALLALLIAAAGGITLRSFGN